MYNKSYNNDFFGWNGTISRKNYAINMFIVVSLFVLLFFVNFRAFEPFVPFKILLTILTYIAGFLKIVLVMCVLSLVYRRIADFSGTKPYKFQIAMKRVFVFLYVVPSLYFLAVRYFFDFMPFLVNIMDLVTLLILIPGAIILSVVFCFIKGI